MNTDMRRALRLGSEPAMPCLEHGGGGVRTHMGLSKRELLAAMVLQGIAANPGTAVNLEGLTAAAVRAADTLLEELAK